MERNQAEKGVTRRDFLKGLGAAIALAAAGSLLPAGVLAQTDRTGQVLGSQVNLRSLPDVASTSLQKLDLGDEVTILDETGGWYKVRTQSGATGYVMSDLIFVRSLTDRIAYSDVDGINLRSAPSQSASVVTTIRAGRAVRIKQMVGEWYFVSYDGKTGYVRRDMVTLTNMSGVGGSATLLKFGMEGSEVKKCQQELSRRNFLASSNVTGYYGAKTRDAVQEFQEAAGLSSTDGVAGPETLEALYDTSNGIKKKVATSAESIRERGVILFDWTQGGNGLLARPGGIATVTDVKTGKAYKIRRSGGNKHFDVHPLTADDTAIMKSIYGSWSWARRAIWLTIGNKTYAASQNGMPHSPDPSSSDNFAGHFCIHLKNSRCHGSGKIDPDHQRCVQYAYEQGNR